MRYFSRCALQVAPFVMVLTAGSVLAQPLGTAFTYQGEVRDGGVPATGLYDLRFALYDAVSGGSQLGTTLCVNDVVLNEGRFSALLDFGSQFAGQQRFIEISVRADTGLNCANAAAFIVLGPRQSLTPSPNAIFALAATNATSANNSAQLNGQSGSFYQNATNITGGTLPAARLVGSYPGVSGVGTVTTGIWNAAPVGASFGGTGLSAYAVGDLLVATGVSGFGKLSVGANGRVLRVSGGLPVWGSFSNTDLSVPLALSGAEAGGHIIRGSNSATPNGSGGIFGEATGATGQTYGVYGRTSSTDGRAVYGVADAATGANYGGYFSNGSEDGYGVYATTAGPYGVYGESTAASGFAYGGYFKSTAPGSSRGVYGEADGVSGIGGYFYTSGLGSTAVYGLTDGNYAVHGRNNRTTLTSYGGLFSAYSNAARAVGGFSFSTTGTTYAGYFYNESTEGFGVYATSAGPDGVYGESTIATGLASGGRFVSASSDGRGVLGHATAVGAGDTPYGVRGVCDPATLGYAIFGVGDNGSSGLKSFRIDHPFDPLNKYLLHYASESPEPQNFYSGNVVTDGEGVAWVHLPDYFGEINKDIKYQLTVVDDGADFVFAKVSRRVEGHTFQVRTSKPGIEVSWRVEATRNDLYCRAKQPTDVRNKSSAERGKYQHPSLYGAGPEMGMDAGISAVPAASPNVK